MKNKTKPYGISTTLCFVFLDTRSLACEYKDFRTVPTIGSLMFGFKNYVYEALKSKIYRISIGQYSGLNKSVPVNNVYIYKPVIF
uniref:Secreted protein n=1 Tax=Schistosoma mansoni TaxID=6183 RepID=A0A5K4F848_SCHMA